MRLRLAWLAALAGSQDGGSVGEWVLGRRPIGTRVVPGV